MKWFFREDNNEKDELSDRGIEIFRNKGDGATAFRGIAREVIQNSIDAKNKKINAPLVVKFDFLDLPISEFPDIDGLKKHIIGTKDFCEKKGKTNVALNNSYNQIKLLEKDYFTVLKISDFNTKGVTGSDDLEADNSKWKGLVYNDGDNIKDSSKSLGSFGLGKNASFAVSQLRTVFYVTKDINDRYAMEGVAKLYTSYNNGIKYVCEGYFCNESNGKTRPLDEHDALSVSKLYKRDEYGTDVIIYEPNISLIKNKVKWYLVESIISNFFMAFIDGDLEVIVNDIEINQNKINDVFSSLLKFYDDNSESISPELIRVGQYLETIENGEDFSGDLNGYGRIYFKLLKTQYTKQKNIAIFREHGMLIKEFQVNSASQKFSGVLVVKGEEGIKFLKSIEDPNHQDWDPTREIEDKSMTVSEKKAKLQLFYDWIRSQACTFTKIETSGSIALAGMEDYIQMEDDGIVKEKGKKEINVKKIKRSKKKERERIYEKRPVEEQPGGLDTPSIDHNQHTPNPGPNPNDHTPEPVDAVPKDDAEKKGFIKTYSASFNISPIMKSNGNICTVIFKTKNIDKQMKLKVTAVGEDGQESPLLIKIVDAIDLNSNEHLDVKNQIISGIDSNDLNKVQIIFDDKILCRLKFYVYWEVMM